LIILDVSQIAAWLLGEPTTADATALDRILRDEMIVVPSHWPVEISNVLRTRMRAGQLSIADVHTIIDRLDELTIQVEPHLDLDEIGPVAHFALSHDLTTYDAAYVQLALRHQAPLATLDSAMRRAAMNLKIPLLPAASP
jgi:predicted nucleic acid-binding protein